MSFDGFFLHHMRQELAAQLIGGRIQKINQPFAKELLLQIRSQGKTQRLLVSVHPTLNRIQLTQQTFENPSNPSTFIMVLRKYLQGAIIQDIQQVENDRILQITVQNKDEIGDSQSALLHIELMGKHSNILLIDQQQNKILEAIKHVGFGQNSYRTILPGAQAIQPPADDRANPFTIADQDLFAFLQTNDLTARNLQGQFQGLGRDTALALEAILQEASDNRLATFRSFFQAPSQGRLTAKSFAPIPFPDSLDQTFPSLSETLDFFFAEKAEKDRVQQQAGELIRRVDSELKKTLDKLQKLEKELTDTDTAETYRQKGELLTTYLHQVPNDQEQVTLHNYYTDEPIHISLDKALTPNQNAQRYFKRYQKLKEAIRHLQQQILESQEWANYLEGVQFLLGEARLEDLPELREELVSAGLFKRSRQDKRARRQKPETYLASDQETLILVGRNNLQNDELTFKLAKKDQLWFHAKDIPGSHVVISNNPNPSDEIKTDAAELAAYYSKARHSNLIQVDMLPIKKLHKPKGGRPGFVTYTGQTTLRVTPDPEKIEAMRQAAKKN
ncbi:NFACT family protein [Streptococcus danieliae]|uniref:Rqc2 homolog RqcH n=1 Tax=Streptococcus danieliae TaxID=747656 RepID=A0A7Z0RR98_9STRE|nr:NFACT RNA binding domain-containing protein [Streptococcus danieliae]MBF0717008.1 NFACT family protein [Streptococcus danieliae]NYS48938.1 NFACT family protein [Streptococcus danieliae]